MVAILFNIIPFPKCVQVIVNALHTCAWDVRHVEHSREYWKMNKMKTFIPIYSTGFQNRHDQCITRKSKLRLQIWCKNRTVVWSLIKMGTIWGGGSKPQINVHSIIPHTASKGWPHKTSTPPEKDINDCII